MQSQLVSKLEAQKFVAVIQHNLFSKLEAQKFQNIMNSHFNVEIKLWNVLQALLSYFCYFNVDAQIRSMLSGFCYVSFFLRFDNSSFLLIFNVEMNIRNILEPRGSSLSSLSLFLLLWILSSVLLLHLFLFRFFLFFNLFFFFFELVFFSFLSLPLY